MDNVCHTLVGAAMAEAGLKHRTRFGAAALMIAANIPDLDALVFATGTPSVAFRRGWTHGVVGQALLPVALTLGFMAWARWRPSPGGRPLRPAWVLGLSYLALYSHVFLDYLNNYGVRVLAPLDWRWFYGDAVFIVDPWLWLTLGIGVWLARRWRGPHPARQALVVASCYVVMMLALAGYARAAVARAWEGMHGAPPMGLMVGPVPVSPLSREVIVDAGDHYETGSFRLWPAHLALDDVIPKNDAGAVVQAARRSPGVRGFLIWSRFPFWQVSRSPAGTVATVQDVRFRLRSGQFSATAVVD